MPNLAQLIDARRILESQGIKLAPAVDDQIKNQEDQLIEEELYRALRNAVRDTLSVLDRPITFTLNYDPAAPDTYTIAHSRTGEKGRRNVATIRQTDEAEGQTTSSRRKISMHRLRVIFPDGHSISEKTAAETLRTFIQQVGIRQVMDLNILHNREPLIAQVPTGEDTSGYKLLEDDFYLRVDSTTDTKVRQLRRINLALNLGIEIELVPVYRPTTKPKLRRRKNGK